MKAAFFVLFGITSIYTPVSPLCRVSDGIHTPACGLSLWQHQNGEVSSAAAGPCELQDEGKRRLTFILYISQCLLFTR